MTKLRISDGLPKSAKPVDCKAVIGKPPEQGCHERLEILNSGDKTKLPHVQRGHVSVISGAWSFKNEMRGLPIA
jgi:hypothetical protein